MSTYDDLLRERLRAGFPGLPPELQQPGAEFSAPAGFGSSTAALPFAAVSGTAAGDPNPHRGTGSHHNYPTKRRTVAQGTGVRVCATDSREAAGAITSSPDGPPAGKAAGPVAHAETSGTATGERS